MAKDNIKIYKGDIIFTKTPDKFESIEGGYILVEGNKIKKICRELDESCKNMEITDFGDKMIIPGFVDLHLHAGQFRNLGLGMDKELLPWLETYTFPEESKFQDTRYAREVYLEFVNALLESGTTRSVIFATLHKEATDILFDLINQSGMGAFIGKVNMDRNSPDYLIENTEESLEDTEYFIKKYANSSELVKFIITPRFIPTCSSELMTGLAELAQKYKVPVQSHLSENTGEINWVHELHPESDNYLGVYDKYGILGQDSAVMAHCVHNDNKEIEIMKKKRVFVAHCPTSNINLSSGTAPVKKYMDNGIDVGIGSDISGGHILSIKDCTAYALQASKIYNMYVDKNSPILKTSEAFYLATKGGGKFFGKVGSFEEEYEFDALIINDRNADKSLEERLQSFIYSGALSDIERRFCAGKEIKKI
ncbi:guanine deaminase [Sebaldella sp. S0638]|uniref:guanine deaminase n=1 Tax=Sebaldella sp. S0638 TaxID=2957809 RepID=UPI0020A02E6C|nr:guanine deaminase [Sebaldella sp. S0638]